MSMIYGSGRRRQNRAKLLRNLKKARAQKQKNMVIERAVGRGMIKKMKRGGMAPFLPMALGTLSAAHSALQKAKPISSLKSLGSSLGINLPNNKFGSAIGKVGNFLIDKLGYGRRRRKHHSRRRHRK